MIEKEERFILESPERRRIMIDLYETSLTPEVLEAVIRHIGRLSPRIVKLSIAADRKKLRVLRCAMKKAGILDLSLIHIWYGERVLYPCIFTVKRMRRGWLWRWIRGASTCWS